MKLLRTRFGVRALMVLVFVCLLNLGREGLTG